MHAIQFFNTIFQYSHQTNTFWVIVLNYTMPSMPSFQHSNGPFYPGPYASMEQSLCPLSCSLKVFDWCELSDPEWAPTVSRDEWIKIKHSELNAGCRWNCITPYWLFSWKPPSQSLSLRSGNVYTSISLPGVPISSITRHFSHLLNYGIKVHFSYASLDVCNSAYLNPVHSVKSLLVLEQ